MTTKEKITVMQAYEYGKPIECRRVGSENAWKITQVPQWKWDEFEYRIKLEPAYVPFESCEELLQAMRENGNEVIYQVWYSNYFCYAGVDSFSNDLILITNKHANEGWTIGFAEFCKNYTWASNEKPCGKLKTE